MSGIVDLKELLAAVSPEIQGNEYVFCSVSGNYADYEYLCPIASFVEAEGLTLIVPVSAADRAKLKYEHTYKQITLKVHSSLAAVGLTAAVSAKLASHGISANVVAAYYHDHVFVPAEKAATALKALQELSHPSP